MKNLGFGMMRLPVLSGPTDFDYEQLNQMVDAFLDAGYTYFDTSFVYHNGKSEEATRKALVERHPRESFTVATKFPTFMLVPEEKIESVFQSQLDNLGVDYIDYYLLHNIQNVYYDGYDGNGGIVKTTHLFDHAKKWKEDGKIRHLGISFHSSAKLLDRVLTEHPEIEFVQIALNPIDWDSELVQAGPCYEVIRKQRRGRAGAAARLQAGGRRQSPARPRVPTHRAPGAVPIPRRRAWAWAGAKCRPRPGKEQGAKTRLWAEADPGALPAPCLHGARGPSCPAASPRSGIRAGRAWTSSPEHRRTGPCGRGAGPGRRAASVPDGGRGRKAQEQQPGRIQHWGLRRVWGTGAQGPPEGRSCLPNLQAATRALAWAARSFP